jgi:hypothetical protein
MAYQLLLKNPTNYTKKLNNKGKGKGKNETNYRILF